MESVITALGLPVRSISLAYRRHLPIPDLLGACTLRHLATEAAAQITPPWPDVVVAAGRKTAPVARWIKRQSPAALLVQLMRPANLKDFDLVAVPAHDRPSADPRIIPTLGAPHALTADALTEAVARADPAFRQLPRPRIALLLGGKTQSIAFGTEEATALGNRVNVLASGLSGSVLATTSPRTPSAGADAIEKALLVPHVFHRFAATGANPYRAFLGLADRVVVTSDSASMLSEACAAGCPVHVATLNGTPAKLRALIQDLTERGHIQPWTAEATSTAMPLDEAGRLASVILERLAARSGGAKPLSGRGSVPSPHPL